MIKHANIDNLIDNFFQSATIQESTIVGGPVYTRLNLPNELNPHYNDVIEMDDATFTTYVEKLRLYLLNLWDTESIPFCGNNNTVETVIKKLIKFKEYNVFGENVVFDNNGETIIKGFSNYPSVINHWFPEMLDVEFSRGVKGKISPSVMQLVKDKDEWKKQLYRQIIKNKLKTFSEDKNVRIFPALGSALRITSGRQPAINIRGVVCKHIYQSFFLDNADVDEIIVWDPSMGWGSRLVSFLAATNHDKLKHIKFTYIGTDPNKKIFGQYKKLEAFWKYYIDPDCTANVEPICCGSEVFNETDTFKEYKGKVSLVFTSPPYFHRERYTNEETQSYVKYPEYNLWRDGFLTSTIKNAYDVLHVDGLFNFNVANIAYGTGKFFTIEDDSIRIAKETGFTYDTVYKMLMRSMGGRDSKENMLKMVENKSINLVNIDGRYQKYEPMFVFRK